MTAALAHPETSLPQLVQDALDCAVGLALHRLRAAAAGGLQDCYDATVHQLGYDPLSPAAATGGVTGRAGDPELKKGDSACVNGR